MTTTELADAELAGDAAQIAAWLARRMRGRYAVRYGNGSTFTVWWRWIGTRWAVCDASLPETFVRYELEDAYFRLVADDRYSYVRLQRLINRSWIDGTLLPQVRRELRVDGRP